MLCYMIYDIPFIFVPGAVSWVNTTEASSPDSHQPAMTLGNDCRVLQIILHLGIVDYY